MSPIVDPDAMRLILAWSYTFVEFDDETFSTIILLIPLTQEGLCHLQAKGMYMKYWLTLIVKLDQEKFN